MLKKSSYAAVVVLMILAADVLSSSLNAQVVRIPMLVPSRIGPGEVVSPEFTFDSAQGRCFNAQLKAKAKDWDNPTLYVDLTVERFGQFLASASFVGGTRAPDGSLPAVDICSDDPTYHRSIRVKLAVNQEVTIGVDGIQQGTSIGGAAPTQVTSIALIVPSPIGPGEYIVPSYLVYDQQLFTVRLNANDQDWNDPTLYGQWFVDRLEAGGWQPWSGTTFVGGSHSKDGSLPSLSFLLHEPQAQFRVTLILNKKVRIGINLEID